MPIEISIDARQVRFVTTALATVDNEIRVRGHNELQAIGQIVERDVEARSLVKIDNLPRSPKWADMRVGQTHELVYVVPKQRGSRRGPRKRRNFAPLMLNRAMVPAKTKNQPEVVRRFESLTAEVVAAFNH